MYFLRVSIIFENYFKKKLLNIKSIVCYFLQSSVKTVLHLSRTTIMQQRPQIQEVLQKYMPVAAVPLIVRWISEQPTNIRITPKRKTVLGTYQSPATRNDRHTITINGDMNPYSFLLTFVHEIAHLKTWLKHQHKVLPHGKEWQGVFKDLLSQVLHFFPQDAATALKQYMKNMTAATCRDEDLYKILKKYDAKKDNHFLVEELPENSFFRTDDGRIFQKGEKLRKTYRCKEIKTAAMFRVSGVLEVEWIKK